MDIKEDMDNNTQEMLRIEHVGKDYILGSVTGGTLKDSIREFFSKTGEVRNKQFRALNDVSFSVKKGETIGLIGSNGAGKSTLLKLISRITAPTRGKICINGRVSSMLEVGTGFHQELTGRENIYLNGSILGMSKKEIDAKIDSIIEFSECQNFIDTPVKRYSSGMYVKLAFAVAAHLESEIMIMDEVLAVGDIQFQHKCLDKMNEIAETEGRTIIYVSHNMDTIRKLCKRCIVLNKGNLVFDGPTDEAVHIYNGDLIRSETSIDLSKYIRPGWLQRNDVQLTWAEYPGKDNYLITDGIVTTYVKWVKKEPIDKIGFRFEVFDQNDKPFATAIMYDVDKDGKDDGQFSIDVSNLANGIYHTFYTIFTINAYNETVDLDCVKGLDFQIKDESKDKPMKWVSSSWGYVQLDNIEKDDK